MTGNSLVRNSLHAGFCLLLTACSSPEWAAPGLGGGSGGGNKGKGNGGNTSIKAPPRGYEPGGLLSAFAGDGTAWLRWALPKGGVDKVETGLFLGSDPNTLYLGIPIRKDLKGDGIEIGGLVNGLSYWFGLGIRAVGAKVWRPAGMPMSVTPRPPIYVDGSSNAPNPDGRTPLRPFKTLSKALAAAFGAGGGNIWLRGGDYEETGWGLPQGVHLFGGFAAGFVPEDRDPAKEPTTLRTGPNGICFLVPSGGLGATMDGLILDGRKSSLIGVDVFRSSFEFRNCTIRGFLQSGLRLRNGSRNNVYPVRVSRSLFLGNGFEGLAGRGAFRLYVEGCDFVGNGQEGLDLNDLIALSGQAAVLRVRNSRFLRNFFEGLDVNFSAPLLPGPVGGLFDVLIEGCRFEENGFEGLLLDQDYELAPAWTGSFVVRSCTARANLGAGVHIDADAPGTFLVHDLSATANRGDGLWVTSEILAGTIPVSASAFLGNQGYGIRASQGRRGLLVSHCVLAGNFKGGIVSPVVPSTAHSTVFQFQAAPTAGVVTTVSLDAGAGTFVRAPTAYALVTALAGNVATFRLGAVPAGALVELADDGLGLGSTPLGPGKIRLAKAPSFVRLPASLFVYGKVAKVSEDFRLPAGSAAKGAGLAPPGSKSDAGPRGAPVPEDPGSGDIDDGRALYPPLFYPTGTTPAAPLGLTRAQALTIEFSRALDPATVGGGRVVIEDSNGKRLSPGLSVQGTKLVLSPPPGGWSGTRLEITVHRGLRSTDGLSLAVPIFLTLGVR